MDEQVVELFHAKKSGDKQKKARIPQKKRFSACVSVFGAYGRTISSIPRDK